MEKMDSTSLSIQFVSHVIPPYTDHIWTVTMPLLLREQITLLRRSKDEQVERGISRIPSKEHNLSRRQHEIVHEPCSGDKKSDPLIRADSFACENESN